MLKVNVFVSILLIYIFVEFQVKALTQNFSLCHPHLAHAEYHVPTPAACVRHQQELIHKCSAQVLNPSNAVIKIPVYVCQIYITSWSTIYWFFGSKTHDSSISVGVPPPPQLCHLWSRTFQAPGIGTLRKQSVNSWTTSNKVHFTYSWPREQKGTVKNAMLTKIIATYDSSKKLMNTAMSSMVACNIAKGSCKVGSRVFIWTPPPNFNCPKTDRMGKHDLLLHYHKKILYRVEVPTLQFSIHSLTECTPIITNCYGANTICDPSGLLIIPNNCTEINALNHHHVLSTSLRNETAHYRFSSSIGSRFITEVSDTKTEKMRNLTSDIQYIECQVQALLTTLFSLVAKQYPGEALTTLTGHTRAAITAGDVLTEIPCQRVEGIVLQSLEHENQFSSRPLVEFIQNDTRKVGQIWSDGFLYEGLRFKERYIPGKVVTFRINNEFYVFENYSLRHLNDHVKSLQPSLYQPEYTPNSVDYSEILNLFSDNSAQYVDVQNMLLSISDLVQNNNLLQNFMMSNSDTESADFEFVGSKVRKTLSNVFISIISSITNPVVSTIFTVILFLSMFWAVVLTTIVLKHVVSSLKTKINCKRQNSQALPNV